MASRFTFICILAITYHVSLGKAAWPLFPNWKRRLNFRTLTGKAHPGMKTSQRLKRHYLDLRFLAFQGIYTFLWHLDDILFRGYREVEIENPVFLVGGFRTGSTSLHRIMAEDEGRYISPKVFELTFPFLSIQYLADFLQYADERWGTSFVEMIWQRSVEGPLGPDVIDRHPMSWDGAEEDDMMVSLFAWSGYYAYAMCPDPEQMLENGQISKFSEDEQERIFTLYKKSMQKILYRRGTGKTLLSKSHLIELMPMFKKRFTGSKFVGIMRDPKEQFVSWLCLCRAFTRAWNQGYTVPMEIDIDAHMKFYRLFGKAEAQFFLNNEEEGDEKRIFWCKFKDFVKKPEETVMTLYRQWGVEVSEKHLKSLKGALSDHKKYKEVHKYKNPTLSELGLEESFVEEQFELYNRSFKIKA